jgi:hypothetical protein
MAISLITVLTLSNTKGTNILAQDAGGKTAIENAIAAAGPDFLSASEVGGKPVDIVIPAAAAPATDGAPKAVFRVDFRVGTGPNGTTPAALMVLAWPQIAGSVTTPAAVLASQAAATAAAAAVGMVYQLAQVDQDARNVAAVIAPLTKFQFRSLFTLEELVAIDNFHSNTAIPDASKAILTTIMQNFAAAEDIDLTDPATIAGVNFITTAGLILPARAAQVLANTPPVSAVFPDITAKVGQAMTPVTIQAQGGAGPYTFILVVGWPDGIGMSSTGVISGVPTTAGATPYSVRVKDSVGGTVLGGGTFTVAAS